MSSLIDTEEVNALAWTYLWHLQFAEVSTSDIAQEIVTSVLLFDT